MGNSVKCLIKVTANKLHPFPCPLSRSSCHEGDQVSQVGPAFHKPMLTGSDYLFVLYMLCDGTQHDLLHNFP